MTPTALLTRRPDPHRADAWLIMSGDIEAGRISRAVGLPGAAQRWAWFCGFYPGSNPGEQTHGIADSFDQARADFEKAWQVFSSRRTEADYQAWRDQRGWTARKYAAHDRGQRVPDWRVGELRPAEG